jgi:hypothetical protein
VKIRKGVSDKALPGVCQAIASFHLENQSEETGVLESGQRERQGSGKGFYIT